MKDVLDEMHRKLDRIEKNIPYPPFVFFWLGAVPAVGFIIGMIVYGS